MKNVLLLFLFVLSVLYSTLSIVRHNSFQSGGFDLGLYDQAAWKFAHGMGAYNTVKERIIFGDHLVLTLPIIGILFWIWDDVRMLLIFQALAITWSTLAIYWIAKKRTRDELTSAVIAIIYSIFYGIQYGVFFDFHPVIFGTALIVWLAWAWEFGKKRLTWVFFLGALLTQENMGIAVACLAATFFFRKEFRKQAVFFGIIGIGWSLVAAKIIALFSPVGFQYWPQFPAGPMDALTRLFDSPEKRQVWLYSYAPFAFLPLFSAGSVLAVMMDLSQYFVTGPEFARMWSPFMHHRVILAPFLLLGMIDVAEKFRSRYLVIVVFCVFVFFQYFYHFPLNKLAKAEFWKQESWMADDRALLSAVPAGASVATQQNFVPHLSHRNEIYLAWPRQHDIASAPCGQSLCWWLDFGGTPDYLVVDTRPDQWLTQILETNEHWLAAIANMEKTGAIVLKNQVGDARVYRIIR